MNAHTQKDVFHAYHSTILQIPLAISAQTYHPAKVVILLTHNNA